MRWIRYGLQVKCTEATRRVHSPSLTPLYERGTPGLVLHSPFSPVQRALKFSAVLGTTSWKVRYGMGWDEMDYEQIRAWELRWCTSASGWPLPV